MATTTSAKKGAKARSRKSKDGAKSNGASAPAKASKGKKPSKATKAKKSAKADKAADKKSKKGKKAKKGKSKSNKKLLKAASDPLLFSSFSEGERADALRILISDRRLGNMAKVGRYRVIAVEPLVVKPPNPLAGRRLARIVAYDYSADKSVHACVDIAGGEVAHLSLSRIQPMLSQEEEVAAISIAMASEKVADLLSLGDEPQVAMHYWSNREAELAFRRRSAVVMFGPPGGRPTVVAVVDLLDATVAEVVPADHW